LPRPWKARFLACLRDMRRFRRLLHTLYETHNNTSPRQSSFFFSSAWHISHLPRRCRRAHRGDGIQGPAPGARAARHARPLIPSPDRPPSPPSSWPHIQLGLRARPSASSRRAVLSKHPLVCEAQRRLWVLPLDWLSSRHKYPPRARSLLWGREMQGRPMVARLVRQKKTFLSSLCNTLVRDVK
jgi:hypothetical protein